MEYEKFYDEVKSINGTLRVTIPYKIAEYAGIKEGDKLKIMIQKMPKKEKEE